MIGTLELGERAAAVVAGGLLLLTAPLAWGQSNQGIVVPLSDPQRPVTLEVSLVTGSVSVTGTDANEIVIVDRDMDDEEPARGPRREGLVRIPNTSFGMTVEERDNTVSISVDPTKRGVDVELRVPRNTSVRARTVNGGDVRIEGVSGEHELSNVNGDIIGVDVAGSVVAATTNGEVEISFTQITPDKAMSFTSFNGDIEVTFPAGLAANLRLNAGRGEAYVDERFEFQQQPQRPVIDRRGGNGGRFQVRVEREVQALVGGGGPEMHFKTFNGDIVIRRR